MPRKSLLHIYYHMNKEQLKKLIAECIAEELDTNTQPEATDEGFFDTVKQFGAGIAKDVKQRYDTAKVAGAGDEFKRLNVSILNDLTASLRKAQKVGQTAKMSNEDIKKAFAGQLQGMMNKLKAGKL